MTARSSFICLLAPCALSVAWAGAAAAAAPAAAAPAAAGPAALDSLMALADLRSPAVRAASAHWQAAREDASAAGALPDPRLSYGYQIESVETRVGPQRQRVSLTQTIPLFGKRGLAADVSAAAAGAAGARFRAARDRVRFRLREAWNDHYALSRSMEVTEESIGLMTRLEGVVRARYAAGGADYAAVVRAQVELVRLEDRLSGLEARREAIVARINAELDRDARTPIALPAAPSDVSLAAERDSLVALALRTSPLVSAARSEHERSRAAKRLARRRSTPDLTLGAEIIDTGEARMAGVPDSGKDPIIAMASINLPIWRGRYAAETRAAGARAIAAEEMLRRTERELERDVTRALIDVEDADRRLALYESALLPRARQARSVTEEAFIAGNASFLDLVDAERVLLDIDLEHARAEADRASAHAELLMHIGERVANGEDGPS